MVRLRHWWSRLGGLAAACLIAVLVASPVLDTVVCQDDGEPAAASSTFDQAQALSDVDHSTPDQGHGSAGVCVHGHCHHGAANAALNPEITARLSPVLGRLASLEESQHDSEAPNRLDRPPRA